METVQGIFFPKLVPRHDFLSVLSLVVNYQNTDMVGRVGTNDPSEWLNFDEICTKLYVITTKREQTCNPTSCS